jgi:hypothetical protein
MKMINFAVAAFALASCIANANEARQAYCTGSLNLCVATSQQEAAVQMCWSDVDMMIELGSDGVGHVKMSRISQDPHGKYSIRGTADFKKAVGPEKRLAEMRLRFIPEGDSQFDFIVYWGAASDQTDLSGREYKPVQLYSQKPVPEYSDYQQAGLFRCYPK